MGFREELWKLIGGQLSSKRKEKGLTQAELATRLDVSKPFISQIENGKRSIPEYLIPQISALLDFDFVAFLHSKANVPEETNSEKTKTYQEILELLNELSENEQKCVKDFLERFVVCTSDRKKEILRELAEIPIKHLKMEMEKLMELLSESESNQLKETGTGE
jgi:transcriptional regulator with XRE-family HTH domain